MKRAFKWLGILVGLLVVLALLAFFTFPHWFGAALSAASARFGVHIGKYEKLENGRFALSEVVGTNGVFDIKISRIEAYLPMDWYRQIQGTNRETAFLEVNGWRVVLHAREGSQSSERTNRASVYARWKQAEEYITKAREWLPKATLLNGIVQFRGREYTFPVITWDEGKLDAGGVWPVSAVPFDVKGKLTGELPYQISFLMSPLDLRGRLQIVETNDTLNAKGTFFYKETRADLVADFGKEGVLPETATLKALNFKLPADLLKLQKYQDLTGNFTAEWRTNRYKLDLTAHAEPFASATLPTADIQVAATGDTNTVRIETMKSTAPGLEVALSDPIELTYEGRLLSDRSELRIAADLEKVPVLNLKGHFEGILLLKKGEKFPIATIRAAGTNVEAFHWKADRVELAGALNWPRLEELKLSANWGSNGTAAITGSANLQARVLGQTTVQIEGPVASDLLPANISASRIKLSADLSGSISNFVHRGEFEVRDFSTPQTQPMHLEGRWNAQTVTFEQLAIRARAGPAVLFLTGRGYREGSRTNLVVRELTLSKGDETYLRLEQPATVSLLPGRTIELTTMHLQGDDRFVRAGGTLNWPEQGVVHFESEKINPELLQSFVKRSLREFDLQKLDLALRWSNGPVLGNLAGRFSIVHEPFGKVGADAALEFASTGIHLKTITLSDRVGEIGGGRGFVPVSLTPTAEPPLRIERNERIDLEFQASTNQAFWSSIGQMANLGLTNAALQLVVHGTPNRPNGDLHFSAGALQLIRTNQDLPPIGPVNARFALDEQVLRIRELSVQVLEQSAEVSGRLELGSNFWTQRREEILNYALDNAELRVQAPNVAIAPFTTYLPKYLSPQGRLALDLNVKPGRNVQGKMQVRGVETRPLPKIGVVQSIRAEVHLEDKEATIEELSGLVGGERLTVNGQIDLSPESVAQGYPRIDLAINGSNIPLARNPDVILRSDLNLTVRNGTNHIPVISGEAVLGDSFLFRDIATLVPGRLARPSRRPPYFSVEQDPIDDWNLNVRVHGENFMRVRSPFFQGVVSANFNIIGTAREPMALGEAAIRSGAIIFPFAVLEVRQALATINSEDPYVPHVFAIAEGRAFGFDIRMQAEGPANEPVIQFSSVPALSSEQIVLMLTTGQIPRDDFSFSNQDRVSKLAFFLGKSLLQKLRPGKTAEEKLTIRSGRDITEQGRQTYEVEYKFSPRWSLVGEYDRFGALNANVKWRLISR